MARPTPKKMRRGGKKYDDDDYDDEDAGSGWGVVVGGGMTGQLTVTKGGVDLNLDQRLSHHLFFFL